MRASVAEDASANGVENNCSSLLTQFEAEDAKDANGQFTFLNFLENLLSAESERLYYFQREIIIITAATTLNSK